ncbi:MAG: hypothetical protein MJ252_07965, partial [archaeon]|nr:hypothetical protein [archaeon]
KKDTFKVNKDFDFDSLLDEPQDSKGKFNNDLDFDTNKMSQMSMKPIINSNNSRRMRSARKFLEENNDMDFTSQKNMSVNPSMGSGSNYHFGGNSGGSSFQPSFNQPSMGRRGNDNMMIGDSNYGIGRTEDKPNGNSVLFGMASRRRK